MIDGTVASPHELGDACRIRAERPDLTVVAGGTDVMVPVNAGRHHPTGWLSLRRLGDLRGLGPAADGSWWLGAGVTWSRLLHADVAGALPALAAAARTVGSPQIRAAGTLGGNLGTASPAGDALPVLLVHDAEVALVSVRGERRLALGDFLVGPKQTALAPDELIHGVHLASRGGAAAFAKLGPRNAMVIAVCSVAARLDAAGGRARVAIGSAAPTARRVVGAEPLLLDPEAAEAFGEAVAAGSDPIDDHRASAAHRRHALRVLGRRLHGWLWAEQSGSAGSGGDDRSRGGAGAAA